MLSEKVIEQEMILATIPEEAQDKENTHFDRTLSTIQNETKPKLNDASLSEYSQSSHNRNGPLPKSVNDVSYFKCTFEGDRGSTQSEPEFSLNVDDSKSSEFVESEGMGRRQSFDAVPIQGNLSILRAFTMRNSCLEKSPSIFDFKGVKHQDSRRDTYSFTHISRNVPLKRSSVLTPDAHHRHSHSSASLYSRSNNMISNFDFLKVTEGETLARLLKRKFPFVRTLLLTKIHKFRERKKLEKRRHKKMIRDIFEDKQDREVRAEFLLTQAMNTVPNDKTRYKMASDYFTDGLYSRRVRYTFSNRYLHCIYRFQTHPLWYTLTGFLAWMYLLLSIFEPPKSTSHPFHIGSQLFYVVFFIELLIIICILIDDLFEFIHRWNDKESSRTKNFLQNKKFIIKYFLDINIIIDFIIFWWLYSNGIAYFRYGRLLRPFKLISFSHDLRRFAIAIVKTIPYIIDVILLYVLVCFIFAILGVKLLEDATIEDDERSGDNDFSGIDSAMNTLYMLISLENYPAVLKPYIYESDLYYIYFFPFIFIVLIFLGPIPVAVCFEKFREQRGNLLIKDRMREKEAFFAVYSMLDYNVEGYITDQQWNGLFKAMYNNMQDDGVVSSVFNKFDKDKDGKINIIEFLDLCDWVLSVGDLSLPYLINPVWWTKFRKFCNDKLKFRIIISSVYFEAFIMTMVLCNIIVIILYGVITDEQTVEILDNIDLALLIVFVVEVILKIIGLGVVGYFKDNWNKFDFSLVIASIFLEGSMSMLKVARTSKSAKVAKVAKVSKSQRGLKLIRGLKSFRAARILHAGVSTFIRIKEMIQRMLLTFPSVKKLLTLTFIIFYVYACIGMEVYGYSATTDFQEDIYGDFLDFTMSLIILFQVLTLSNWNCVVFHYASTSDSYFWSLMYFYSFNFLTVIILLSLITGLIWEVFTILDPNKQIREDEAKKKDAASKQPVDGMEREEKSPQIFGSVATSSIARPMNEEEEARERARHIASNHAIQGKFKLREALMKDKSAQLMKKLESEYLQTNFTSFNTRIGQVVEDVERKAISLEREAKAGAIILNAMRMFKETYQMKSFIKKLNYLLKRFASICPTGTVFQLVFDINDGNKKEHKSFMIADEEYAKTLSMRSVVPYISHIESKVLKIGNFFQYKPKILEEEIKDVEERAGKHSEVQQTTTKSLATTTKSLPTHHAYANNTPKVITEDIDNSYDLDTILSLNKHNYREHLAESIQTIQEYQGINNSKMQDYQEYEWILLVTSINIEPEEEGGRFYLYHEDNKHIAEDDTGIVPHGQMIRKAYMICLIPHAAHLPENHLRQKNLQEVANRLMAASKNKTMKIKELFSVDDIRKVIEELKVIFGLYKVKLFDLISEYAANAMDLNCKMLNFEGIEELEKKKEFAQISDHDGQ